MEYTTQNLLKMYIIDSSSLYLLVKKGLITPIKRGKGNGLIYNESDILIIQDFVEKRAEVKRKIKERRIKAEKEYIKKIKTKSMAFTPAEERMFKIA